VKVVFIYFAAMKNKGQMNRMVSKAFFLYYDGFRNMTLGKKLWLIIAIKLVIIFLVMKLFFFPDILKKNFSTDKERADHVIKELTKTK
jgi:hypothetical protein